MPSIDQISAHLSAPAVHTHFSKDVKQAIDGLGIRGLYDEAIATLDHYDFPVDAFNFDRVIGNGESVLNAQALRGEIKLLLVPGTASLKNLTRAINHHRNPVTQNACMIREPFERIQEMSPDMNTACLIEADINPDVYQWDKLEASLPNRYDRAANYATSMPGLGEASHREYALLMMQSLMRGGPIDTETWTMLGADRYLSNGWMPYGNWHGRTKRVDFMGNVSAEKKPKDRGRPRFLVQLMGQLPPYTL